MNLKRDWLWDRKIPLQKARAILKNPNDKHFLSLSSVLLARKNSPQEVFKVYISPLHFLVSWNKIKRKMRKDAWNNPRIVFWQAIYEKLREKYRKKGKFPLMDSSVTKPTDEFCKLVANKLKDIRKKRSLTQSALARKLKVSQQMISRIERGRENLSLITLKNIVNSLGAELQLEIVDNSGN